MTITIIAVSFLGAITASILYLFKKKTKTYRSNFSNNFTTYKMHDTDISIDEVVKNFKSISCESIAKEKEGW